jgi:hypothetical protein
MTEFEYYVKYNQMYNKVLSVGVILVIAYFVSYLFD